MAPTWPFEADNADWDRVVGIDIQAEGIATATTAAGRAGLAEKVQVIQHDASQPLPFPDAASDGPLCIDASNHLPD